MATSSQINELVSKLTLEEKVSLLAGADIWHTQEIDRLGIGSIKTTDGPSGARGKFVSDGAKAAFVPGPVCQAATWSKTQMRDLGRLLCKEAKTKSAHVLLAPTICCARNPLSGRNFECFGEDPFLSGSLAVEYVQGVQGTGEVAATPKHFVANEQEHERFSIDAKISERALREIYLRPFEMVVRGPSPPECLMTSYNSVNGQHADMNEKLLVDILRKEWGFQGLVMSDWGGTNSTLESLLVGVDLEMPGPPERRGKKLLQLAQEDPSNSKLLEAIDISCSRILDLAQKHGLTGLTPEAARLTRESPETSSTSEKDTKLIREIAASGIVLLKNEKSTLPLSAKKLDGKQVAFIGPNALVGTPGGGGSASMNPQYLSQPMESFKTSISDLGFNVSVKHALGAVGRKWLPLFSKTQWSAASLTNDGDSSGKTLLRVEYFASQDLTGPVQETQPRDDSTVDMSDSAPLAFQVDPVPPYSYRVTSVLTPSSSGIHSFSISSVGDATLRVNDELVIDNRNWTQPGETFYAFGSAEVIGKKQLEAGKEYLVVAEGWVRKEPRPDAGFSAEANHVFAAHPSIRLGYQEQLPDDEALITEAVNLANESEVAVIVLGLSDEWESEGYDRQSMALPGKQDALVNALVERVKQPEKLIFVNQSGSPVEFPWIEKVSTMLQAWYGGQEAGNALADVLVGTVNPSGRMPITWPKRYTDLPFASDPESWPGVDGTVTYKEDYQVGYRWYSHHPDVEPQWWFGYGQSYTQFSSKISKVDEASESEWNVQVSVTNTGTCSGAEVVQVYFWPADKKDEVMLVGFEKTKNLASGESAQVDLLIKKRDASRWLGNKWLLEQGEYVFGLGLGVGNAGESTWQVGHPEKTWKA
ncbi:hypothetical protein ACHAPJ_011749 [Fusarium lateritium]